MEIGVKLEFWKPDKQIFRIKTQHNFCAVSKVKLQTERDSNYTFYNINRFHIKEG